MQVAAVNWVKLGFKCNHLQLNGLRTHWRDGVITEAVAEELRNTAPENIVHIGSPTLVSAKD
jgi:hypothetical protein